MMVGALKDLGVPEKVFRDAIEALGLSNEIHLHFKRGTRQNISGVKFDVHAQEHHGHAHHHGPDYHKHDASEHGRSYCEICELLEASDLAPAIKARAQSVFHRIAVAEGKVHGISPEKIDFHEVGAADSIGDIVAACAGIQALEPIRIEASSLIEGTGWIECAHGKFPLPAPATLEILAGIPLQQVPEPVEFITPTGAALLAEYAKSFGPMKEMRIEKVAYGLGTRDTSSRPNVLRAIFGEVPDPIGNAAETDEIAQIETNLDDITPELAGAAMQKLFKVGALDVFFTPAQMKKSRPGFVLTALCPESKAYEIAKMIMQETSSFGVRIHRAHRLILRREIREVETPYGKVQIKLGFLGDDLVQASPEFESCRTLAEKAGVSVRDVHLAAWIGTPPKPQ